MRYWLQPPHRDEVLRPVVHFAVMFGGGGSLVAIVAHKVLGITDPEVSIAIVSAYTGTSALCYVLWVLGIGRSSFQLMLEQLGMTKGRLFRNAVFLALTTVGGALVYRAWPGEEPWPTVASIAFMGAAVAVQGIIWGWRD